MRIRDASGEVVLERTTSVATLKIAGIDDESGTVADPLEVTRAIDAAEPQAVNERAITLLAYRSRSVAEMYERLKEDGYPLSRISDVVDRLVGIGYLDDTEYAHQFARSKAASGWGFRKVRDGLARKGVSEEIVDSVRDEYFSGDDERERAGEIIARFDVGDRKQRDRAIRRLISKGFSPDVAFGVVRDRRDGQG